MSAAESLTAMSLTHNPGYLPALDAAYFSRPQGGR
jgi:hypothetical protein